MAFQRLPSPPQPLTCGSGVGPAGAPGRSLLPAASSCPRAFSREEPQTVGPEHVARGWLTPRGPHARAVRYGDPPVRGQRYVQQPLGSLGSRGCALRYQMPSGLRSEWAAQVGAILMGEKG